jgi:serine/threonine-protein kinase
VQSLKSGERKELFEGNGAQYLPTGHIVYELANSLFAVRFDVNALKVIGGPVSVVEGVLRIGAPQYAVSDSGTLVYIPAATSGTTASNQRTLVWVDRKGKEEPISALPNSYLSPRISPDGTKVAMAISSGAKSDIWIWDILRETMTRLTFDEVSGSPLWFLDGKRIAFGLGSPPNFAVYWKAADGTGVDEKLGSVPDRSVMPWSWSNDGKTLVTSEYKSIVTSLDIGSISMEGNHKWGLLLQEKYHELQPEISPDGRCIAYVSNESGKYEIYARPFPDVNKGRWQISTAGGDSPLWSPNGRELFYRNGDAIMAVAIETGQTFKAGKPETLFQRTYTSSTFGQEGHPWDISRDGKRFLMMKEVATKTPQKINIVLNWFEELKQRVPVK